MDLTEIVEYHGNSFRWELATKPTGALDCDERLADGALVLGTSSQINWFYAQVLIDGAIRTRRYRHGQMVRVAALVPA